MDNINKEHFEKHHTKTLTKEESVQLHSWYLHFGRSAKPLNDNKIFTESLNRMDHAVLNYVKQSARGNKWGLPAVAAFLIISMSVTFYFIRYYQNTAKHPYNDFAKIDPATYKATLEFANNREIKIDNASTELLTTEDGTEVSSNGEGMLVYKANKSINTAIDYHIIKVPKGGKYGVCLPDGTKVWLNAASTLRYPSSFSSLSERRVTLNGEAYFDVSHQREKPFIVEARGQVIRDLGTKFNISSYEDEPVTKTSLLEGSVGITFKASNKSISTTARKVTILKPGQEALFNGTDLQIHTADVASSLAWKNGLFRFHQDDLKTGLRKIARWYNIEVNYAEAVPETILDGTIPNDIPLSDALRILLDGKVKYTIYGRTVTLKSRE